MHPSLMSSALLPLTTPQFQWGVDALAGMGSDIEFGNCCQVTDTVADPKLHYLVQINA